MTPTSQLYDHAIRQRFQEWVSQLRLQDPVDILANAHSVLDTLNGYICAYEKPDQDKEKLLGTKSLGLTKVAFLGDERGLSLDEAIQVIAEGRQDTERFEPIPLDEEVSADDMCKIILKKIQTDFNEVVNQPFLDMDTSDIVARISSYNRLKRKRDELVNHLLSGRLDETALRALSEMEYPFEAVYCCSFPNIQHTEVSLDAPYHQNSLDFLCSTGDGQEESANREEKLNAIMRQRLEEDYADLTKQWKRWSDEEKLERAQYLSDAQNVLHLFSGKTVQGSAIEKLVTTKSPLSVLAKVWGTMRENHHLSTISELLETANNQFRLNPKSPYYLPPEQPEALEAGMPGPV